MKKFDLIVVGGGSGNIVVDAGIAQGLNCAVVEEKHFGGTCLNFGCIPTKVLTTVADKLEEAKHAAKMGLYFVDPQVDWAKIKARVLDKIAENKEVNVEYGKVENLTIYLNHARFVSDHVLALFDKRGEFVEEITAPIIVLAVGGRSRMPVIEGLEKEDFINAETFFSSAFPKRPYRHLTILGGGPIGCEFAHIFRSLGSEVSLVQRNLRLLPKEEPELSLYLQERFSARGIDLHLQTVVVGGQKTADGYRLTLKNAQGEQEILETEAVLVAMGIVPATDGLAVDRAGIALDEAGFIRVNDYLETAVPGIYAIGDVNGGPQFRHRANHDADLVSFNLWQQKNSGLPLRKRYDELTPSVTYTGPQIARIGMSEAEARRAGHRLLVGRNYYSATAKGYALGYLPGDEDDGYVKMIVDADSKEILGVHAVGLDAALLVQPYHYVLAAAVHELPTNTTTFVDRVMVAHPCLGEVSGWVTWYLKEVD